MTTVAMMATMTKNRPDFKIAPKIKAELGTFSKNLMKLRKMRIEFFTAKQGPPCVLSSLSDTTVICGKSTMLQCEVRGSPIPTILWRKNGRVIGNTKDFQQTYENNMARLTIKDILVQDGGCYDCVARNTHGVVTTTCKVTVSGK